MSTPPPAPIEPETKSWTWVLERACPECGFDASGFDATTIGVALEDNARRWAAVLERAAVAQRPRPDVWSPLEYACHVRDVFRMFDGRLRRMVTEDGPHFANWDQDASAVEERYDLQHPRAVGAQLTANASALAHTYATVTDWARPGFRSDGAAFTIDSFTRYLIHDPLHHLWDVGG